MENYADYEFYLNEYKGTLSIDLFNTYIVKASRNIDRNVNCELSEELIESLTEKEQFMLKYVACELCDFLKNNGDDTKSNASSVSLDGISISKKNGEEKRQSLINIYNDLPQKLTRYL